ncbi:MAG: MBL fold metallo-hydrolase, partial [Acholeplasmatales bacterium]|nr:MBL fold metallo-hydrolase [Acholeplasmatales bacterium]
FNDISELYITHSHADHIKGLPIILKRTSTKVYMSKGTYCDLLATKDKDLYKEHLESNRIILLNRLDKFMQYEEIIFDDYVVEPIPTFHDASESVGYIFKENDKKLVYITDTGYVHNNLFDKIANAEVYVLESNHDHTLLMNDPHRPLSLKLRIISDHGHMSNEDSMVLLAKIISDKTKVVMHAHISQECNLTQIVELTRKKVFADYGLSPEGVEFVITSPYRTKEFEV